MSPCLCTRSFFLCQNLKFIPILIPPILSEKLEIFLLLFNILLKHHLLYRLFLMIWHRSLSIIIRAQHVLYISCISTTHSYVILCVGANCLNKTEPENKNKAFLLWALSPDVMSAVGRLCNECMVVMKSGLGISGKNHEMLCGGIDIWGRPWKASEIFPEF